MHLFKVHFSYGFCLLSMQEDNKLFLCCVSVALFNFLNGDRTMKTKLVYYLGCLRRFPIKSPVRTACQSEISGNLKSLFSLLFCYLCLYFCLRRAQFIKYLRVSSREGIPGNSWRMGWRECAVRLSKSRPYFRPIPIRQM